MAPELAHGDSGYATLSIVLVAWHPHQSLGDPLVTRLSEWDLASNPLMGTGKTTFAYTRREA